MEPQQRLTMYFFACGFVLLLTVLHVFRIFSLPTDKLSYFLISLVVILFLLPVVGGIRFFGIAYIQPRKSVLSKKK